MNQNFQGCSLSRQHATARCPRQGPLVRWSGCSRPRGVPAAAKRPKRSPPPEDHKLDQIITALAGLQTLQTRLSGLEMGQSVLVEQAVRSRHHVPDSTTLLNLEDVARCITFTLDALSQQTAEFGRQLSRQLSTVGALQPFIDLLRREVVATNSGVSSQAEAVAVAYQQLIEAAAGSSASCHSSGTSTSSWAPDVPLDSPELSSHVTRLQQATASLMAEVQRLRSQQQQQQQQQQADSWDSDSDGEHGSEGLTLHYTLPFLSSLLSYLQAAGQGRAAEHLLTSQHSLGIALLVALATTWPHTQQQQHGDQVQQQGLAHLKPQLRQWLQLDVQPRTQRSGNGTHIITCSEIRTTRAGLGKARKQLQLALRVLELALAIVTPEPHSIQLIGTVYIAHLDDMQRLEPLVTEQGNLFIEVRRGL